MSDHPDVPPVSPDRPVVDGRDRSPDDLRAEVQRHSDADLQEAQQNAQQRRAELGETVAELAARLDLPTRARSRGARIGDTVLTATRAHTELIMGAVAVVLFAVVARRVRSATR